MNRIRELRIARGLTEAELARRVGTSQPQIRRLEAGQRRLTEDWMRRIAKALDVRPADLLATVTAADFVAELEVDYSSDAVRRRFATIGFDLYVARSDSVSNLGIAPGTHIIVNTTKTHPSQVKTGDVVVLRVHADPEPVLVLRQFLAPGLITTNRPGTNLALSLSDAPVTIEIIGAVEMDPLKSH